MQDYNDNETFTLLLPLDWENVKSNVGKIINWYNQAHAVVTLGNMSPRDGVGFLSGMSGFDKCTCSIEPTVLTSAAAVRAYNAYIPEEYTSIYTYIYTLV